MKAYSILPTPPEHEPHHQMQFSVISRTPFVSVLTILQKMIRCILSPAEWVNLSLDRTDSVPHCGENLNDNPKDSCMKIALQSHFWGQQVESCTSNF